MGRNMEFGERVSMATIQVRVKCKGCHKMFRTMHALRRYCLECSPPSTAHEAAKYARLKQRSR